MGDMKFNKNSSSVGYNVITGEHQQSNKYNNTINPQINKGIRESLANVMFNPKPLKRPMTASSINFDNLDAKNLKSYVDMQAFDGLSALVDESAKINDRKKKERDCLLRNTDSKNDKLSNKQDIIRVNSTMSKNNIINTNQDNDLIE